MLVIVKRKSVKLSIGLDEVSKWPVDRVVTITWSGMFAERFFVASVLIVGTCALVRLESLGVIGGDPIIVTVGSENAPMEVEGLRPLLTDDERRCWERLGNEPCGSPICEEHRKGSNESEA